jgi:hypothetical protein
MSLQAHERPREQFNKFAYGHAHFSSRRKYSPVPAVLQAFHKSFIGLIGRSVGLVHQVWTIKVAEHSRVCKPLRDPSERMDARPHVLFLICEE